jgi:hypothetical protein
MAPLIYALCALTCVAAAVLLLRAWAQSKLGMLFWSGWCFAFLAASNFLLVLDRIVLPDTDLQTARFAAAFVGLLLLLYGLIMEGD